jgi:hypothetical protein
MRFLNRLRIKIGRFFLKGELIKKQRSVKQCGFESAKSIGIIYNVSDDKSYKLIASFSKNLRERGIKDIYALGYIITKNRPAFIAAERGFDYFSPKDLNWFYIPQSKNISDFIEKKFDILLDLSTKKYFPVEYIISLSQAGFIAGADSSENNLYDITISTENKNDTDFIIKNITHYIQLINSEAK